MPSPATQALKTEFVSNWAELFARNGLRCNRRATDNLSQQIEREYKLHSAFAAKQPFWIARYKGTGTTSPPVQSDTPKFPAWSFWQWSDGSDAIAQSNQIPGTSTTIDHDRDVYSGTLAQLAAMTVKVVQGDYNHNNTVDTGDYVTWRKTMSLPTAQYNAYSVAFLGADGNLSNKVDAGDYTYWRSQYGKTLSGSGSGSGLDSLGVPEPCSAFRSCFRAFSL